MKQADAYIPHCHICKLQAIRQWKQTLTQKEWDEILRQINNDHLWHFTYGIL